MPSGRTTLVKSRSTGALTWGAAHCRQREKTIVPNPLHEEPLLSRCQPPGRSWRAFATNRYIYSTELIISSGSCALLMEMVVASPQFSNFPGGAPVPGETSAAGNAAFGCAAGAIFALVWLA